MQNTVKFATSRGQVIVQEVNKTFIFLFEREKKKNGLFLSFSTFGRGGSARWHVIVSPIAHRQTVNKIRITKNTIFLRARRKAHSETRQSIIHGKRRSEAEDGPIWESGLRCDPCIIEHTLQHSREKLAITAEAMLTRLCSRKTKLRIVRMVRVLQNIEE